MPIFDQGYQHWKGPLASHAWRWLAIARQGARLQLKGRVIRFALLLAWVPTAILIVVLALWGLVEQGNPTVVGFARPILPAAILAEPVAFRDTIWTLSYTYFFRVEMFCIMLLVVVAGPSLISADLRFNALPLYFSRPLNRLDYFLGKLGVIAVLVAAVAVSPAMLAYTLGVCFSLDLTVVSDTWRLLVASAVYGVVIVVSAGTMILALSSLSRRSLYVGMAWLGLWLVGSTVAGVLGGIEQGMLMHTLVEEEMAKANVGPQPQWNGDPNEEEWKHYWQAQSRARMQARGRFTDALAEFGKTDWRPLCSYTANLQRIGEELLGANAAFLKFGQTANNRRLAEQNMMHYPWWWSAGVLAGLWGISVCTLSGRVKSLDRLR